MQRNINNEFERFLKENADQYRLYPSTKVWKGIHSALHSRRRWYGLGILLLLITGTLITLLITKSSKQSPVALNNPYTATPVQSPAEDPAGTTATGTRTTAANTKPVNTFSSGNTASINNRRNDNNQSYSILYDNGVYNTTINAPEIAKIEVQTAAPVQNNSNTIVPPVHPLTNNANIIAANQNTGNKSATDNNKEFNAQPAIAGNFITAETDNNNQPIATANTDNLQKQSPEVKQPLMMNAFDWTIESVLNSYSRKKKHLIDLELDLTPTISYRKLSENKAFLRSGTAQPYTYAALYNINNVVTHKPDMGLEIGLTAKYAFTSNIKVKAGLQFNINRYDIKAFNYPLEVATIALSAGRQQVDSFRAVSSYRNFNGYKSNWLENFYFQVSMPIGVEVKLAGDEKVQFGLAGTIQPTYVLGDRAYLLSTDYKNYAEVPWLIRRWNANTAFETFVAYSTGKLKWQVGPQVRYQLMSSFKNKYPVKENLFDFGLKIGLSLNN